MDQIYLDHNSTTPIDPRVAEAVTACLMAGYANPASQHRLGQKARRALEAARDEIGEILGTRSQDIHADRIIFTSGGTEANNLALLGLSRSMSDPGGNVIVSAIEHPSIMGAADQLRRMGVEVRILPVDSDGVALVEELEGLIDNETRLVSLMLANNETGVIQPLVRAVAICHDASVPIHTDAVQAIGKIDVNFSDLGVDAMSLSAHKFRGPRGIGALIVRHECELDPILFGGFQQQGLRPGTEDVALATGLCVALRLWREEIHGRHKLLLHLRDRLEANISNLDASVVINGVGACRLPHTSNISFPGADRQAVLLAADMAGVAISTGSACASGSSEPSPVLLAMGCDPDVIASSIRFSVGMTNTIEEIDLASERMGRILQSKTARN